MGKLQTQSIFKVGRSLSFAYTVNTIGAVLGSFCSGFVLMPFLGQESGLKIVIGLQLGTALFAGAGSLARKSADWGRLAPWLGAALLILWPISYLAVRAMRVWAAVTDLARKPEYVRAE